VVKALVLRTLESAKRTTAGSRHRLISALSSSSASASTPGVVHFLRLYSCATPSPSPISSHFASSPNVSRAQLPISLSHFRLASSVGPRPSLTHLHTERISAKRLLCAISNIHAASTCSSSLLTHCDARSGNRRPFSS